MELKLTISIASGLVKRIDDDVAARRFKSASEAIEAALVMYYLPEDKNWPPSDDDLRQAVNEALADPREYSGEEMREHLRALYESAVEARSTKKIVG